MLDATRELSWVILTIGHLSTNRFWGETERRRGPLCTSTLIRSSSIDRLTQEADIIIPGHGNAFLTALVPEPSGMWSGGKC